MTDGHSEGNEGEVAVEVESAPPVESEESTLEESGADVGSEEEAELPSVGLARRVEVGTQE